MRFNIELLLRATLGSWGECVNIVCAGLRRALRRVITESGPCSIRAGHGASVGVKRATTLTSRENEVLRLVASGLTNAEIAERLVISQKTAGNHVSSILTKLNVRSRTEAAMYQLAHTD